MLDTLLERARFALLATFVLTLLQLTGCAGNGANRDSMSMSDMGVDDPGVEVAISDEPIERERITLVVYGMSCPLCATNVDKQLLAVAGVTSVNVDLSTGNIDVLIADEAPRPSTRQLADAVVRSGFTLKDIKRN